MSFDPEKVKRYWPDNNGNMEEDTYHEGGYVRHEDYAQLKAILHDVATEADPAGTVRELRLAQDTIRAQEVLIQELRAETRGFSMASETPEDLLEEFESLIGESAGFGLYESDRKRLLEVRELILSGLKGKEGRQ